MLTTPTILAIDFDGVIHDHTAPIKGKRMGEPLSGSKEALDDLIDKGFRIVIYSVKARTPSGNAAVRGWLDYWDMPYHEVTALKPNADVYIDDRAVRHESWNQTMQFINSNYPNWDD